MKFLDTWSSLCMTFVFMTLVEIVAQHLIVTKRKQQSVRDENGDEQKDDGKKNEEVKREKKSGGKTKPLV